MKNVFATFLVAILFFCGVVQLSAAEPVEISGVYPHLRMWNSENECGSGALVLWQGDLWAVTYAPHSPRGSSDKLYQITPDLKKIIFESSVGGTPANRMIHRETNQLLIGPYLIDAAKKIRVIQPADMLGRLTANARHLTNPGNKVYYATMEEGLYEVDLKTLAVKCLIRDGHTKEGDGVSSEFPGYHGKGLYSTQGRVVYANNGEVGASVKTDPTVPSGALGQWFGGGDWQLIRRNQFTEVTGPGGIYGNENPESDPIWAMGWDARSLILALLEKKKWHYFRLPKGSHSYDGAHGWNTEWPRIREIGEGDDFLATMHGTFWKFPATFSLENSAGITPHSNYLKVIGDFCRWNDHIVFGCDDSAKAEFLNTRPFKSEKAAPKQSNSNFWFVTPDQLDDFGPAIGRGSVWLRDSVKADEPSDPYLFSGYDHRQLHLKNDSAENVTVSLEIDHVGNNTWKPLRDLTIPAGDAISHLFGDESGIWIRLKTDRDVEGITANFQYRNHDSRDEKNAGFFAGIATAETPAARSGMMRSLAYDRLGLVAADGDKTRFYEINEALELVPVDDLKASSDLVNDVRQPENTITVDAASVLMIEDGKRYRLPKNDAYKAETAAAAKMSDSISRHFSDNLLLDATVAASSTHLDFSAEKAVDGQRIDEGRWISANEAKPWIEFEFKSETTFQNLWVISGWKNEIQYVAKNFDVQIPEGDSWKTVPPGEIRDNKTIERSIEFETPVTTKKLRLASQDHGFLRMYEIAAFEKTVEIAPPNARDFGIARICREVATERDLLNVHGTFYELPARNAQGLAKARPIATHNLAVQDFCSHNGLIFFTGLDSEAKSERIFRSEDGKAAVWAGVIDDLWKLGKPRGTGGPWSESDVKADEPSDPYLMTGYDKKSVTVSSSVAAKISFEVDIDGTGLWIPAHGFSLKAGESVTYEFPEGFSAYWVRAISDTDTTASAIFKYE